MNKTLIYIAVGLGILYFLKKRVTKKIGSAIESSLKPVEPIKDDPSTPLSDLQVKTANMFIEAGKRRKNFFVVNNQNEELIKKYFATINDRKKLLEYQSICNPKIDKKLAIVLDPKLSESDKIQVESDLFFDYDITETQIKRLLDTIKKSPILQARSNFNFDDGL